MRVLMLHNGEECQVDDADYEWLRAFDWYKFGGYAVRSSKFVVRLMHRLLLPVADGFETDHIDGNRLNNQRSNLRQVTHGQNIHNQPKRAGCKSVYKGVVFVRHTCKWQARITIDGKRIPLGCYVQELDAALAYDEAARWYYGTLASVNGA